MGALEETAIINAIQHVPLLERSLAALLTLLMMARPDRSVVKGVRQDLGAQDLAGMRFDGRDLSDLSFCNSDLSNVIFRNCDLHRARFDGAFLSRTRFEGNNSLEDAQFGDFGRIQSIFVRGKMLDQFAEVKEWVEKATGRPPPPGEPCPTGLQVFRMFSKFVTPLGTPRRDDLPRHALVAGRRYQDAASPAECLAEAVHHRYLTGPDHRDRFRRAEGDKYAEMVAFVRDVKVSDALGSMIAPMCRRRGCVHQIRT